MRSLTYLALSNNKKNKTRSILIIISIFLSTLSLMIIATWGYGIIKSYLVNAAKLYGKYEGRFTNVSQKQLSEMYLRNEFAEIGKVSRFATVDSEDNIYLYYADETALKLANMYDNLQEGTFPQKENEIAGPKVFFNSLGYETPKAGDRITLYYRTDNKSRYKSAEFIISGILKDTEYDELSRSHLGYVSEKFFSSVVEKNLRSYIALVQLNPSVSINYNNAEKVLQELAAKCGIKKSEVNLNIMYIMFSRDPGTETISACIMIAALIIVFSVVVIYNIFQVGISYKVQEYGKIKALGATKKQLKKLIFCEGMMLAAVGVPLGILAGYAVSVISFGKIIMMSVKLQGGNVEQVSLFNLPLIILVASVSFITVWLAIKKPMRIISSISIVESLRYHEGANIKKGDSNAGLRNGKKSIDVRRMILANISWNKKRTISTILTMGLSCVLYVAISNLAGNIDEDYEARKMVEYGQFFIKLDYTLNDTAYPENNLANILKNNPLTPELIEKISAIEEVTDVKTRKLFVIKVKSDNTKEQLMDDVAVLDKKDFDKFKSSGNNIGDIDYDTAVKNKAIFYGWSRFWADSGYELNQTLDAELISGTQSVSFKSPLMGSFGTIHGPDWVITEDTFKELNIKDNVTGFVWVDCAKKDVDKVRSKLNSLLSDTKHLEITEYSDEYKVAQFGSRILKIGIYSFLTIIGTIGFLNMANTIITSIITRKKEYGLLQAIGMTNRQLNLMLQSEGLIFTIGTVLIAIVIGMPAGYGIFSIIKRKNLFGINMYKIPFLEIGIMTAVIISLQIILSFLLSRNIKKESLVERIRYYE